MHLVSHEFLAHLAHTYGLWVVFGVVLLECVGIPLPGETALVGAAIYAGTTHNIHIAAVIAVAAAAAIIGATLGYLIGRSIGFRLLVRYGSYVRLDEPRLKVGEYLFRRHGGKIVFFGRFIAILRAYAALLAGANRMPWHRLGERVRHRRLPVRQGGRASRRALEPAAARRRGGVRDRRHRVLPPPRGGARGARRGRDPGPAGRA
jgi:membrane protein YqaA with SNARE-associated domain